MTEPTREVLTDSERTVPVSRDLAYEIAACSAAILDTEEEKTRVAKTFTAELKQLKKRQRELIGEIRASGNTQLVMNFGSSVNTVRALAKSAPTGGEEGDVDPDEDRLDAIDAALTEEEEGDDSEEATH